MSQRINNVDWNKKPKELVVIPVQSYNKLCPVHKKDAENWKVEESELFLELVRLYFYLV